MSEIASAFVTIAPSTKGFGSTLSRQVGSETSKAGRFIGSGFGKAFLIGAGAIAVAGVTKLLTGSIDEAREAQKVGAATEQIIKATGGAAQVTTGYVEALASSISKKTGLDDEQIQTSQNLLLTFKQVRDEFGKGNDIFTRATHSLVDLSAAGFGSTDSAAKMLGKALQDPVKGITALSRAGVTFTDKQKDQIETMVESGNVLGAQKAILKEVEGQVGGVAEATATSGEKAKVAFGNLKEQIGTALLPVIDKLADTFTNKIAPAISTFVGQLQSGEGVGGQVASVFSTVADALGTLFDFINNNRTVVAVFIGTIYAITAATAAWNAVLALNPISLIIIGIAALAAGLVYAYKHSEKFRAVVDTLFSAMKVGFKVVAKAFGVMFDFIKDHWRLIISILGGPIGLAVALITKHWDKIKAGAVIILGWIQDHWPAIKAVLTTPFETAKRVIGPIWTALRQGASRVKEVITRAFDAISSAIQGAIDKAQTLLEKLHLIEQKKGSATKHPGGSASTTSTEKLAEDAGKVAVEEYAKGIVKTLPLVDGAMEKLGKKVREKVKKLRDQLASVRSDFASLVEPIASNFTQGLFDFDTAGAFTANLTTVKGTLQTLIGNFKKLLGEGLAPGFLYQLFQSGGPGLINSLAGLDRASAQAAGGLFSDVMNLSEQLGGMAAGATDKGAALENQTVRLERKIDKLIKHVDNSAERTGQVINGAVSRGHRRGR